MSQSQSGLLNDDEVRSAINEYFNINLDRDSLAKPTKESLIEIYCLFLDSTEVPWRSRKSREDIPIEFPMIGFINELIKPYDPPYKFLFTDLVKPNRKRTNYFLNALVFIRAQLQDWFTLKASLEERNAELQERADFLKSEVSQKRQSYEEMAMKKASLPSRHELEERDNRLRKELIDMETKSEQLKERGRQVKEEALSWRERCSKRTKDIENLNNEISTLSEINERMKKAEKLLERIPELKDEIENEKTRHEEVMNDLSKNCATNLNLLNLEESEALRKYREKENDLPDPVLMKQQMREEQESTSSRLAQLDRDIKILDDNDAKEIAAMAQFERTLARHEDLLKQDCLKIEPVLAKLNLLPKLEETQDIPADRTYIKK